MALVTKFLLPLNLRTQYQFMPSQHCILHIITVVTFITRQWSSSFTEYWKHFTAHFNDVHASGYNSAGSEQIWMKFEALRVYCLDNILGQSWQILGAIRAERAGERAEIFFVP